MVTVAYDLVFHVAALDPIASHGSRAATVTHVSIATNDQ